MARQDLLAMTPDAAATLITRGHVRRAQKMISKGKVPEMREDDDGTVIAIFSNGVETRLPPVVALCDSPCSCSAADQCYHQVVAALYYKQWFEEQGGELPGEAEPAATEHWSPADFEDEALEAALGKRVLSAANRVLKKGFVAEVHRTVPPTVSLSEGTVRFTVPNELVHARCDCKKEFRCKHVALAVWAFRQADRRDPDSSEVLVELSSGGGASTAVISPELFEDTVNLAREVLLDGTVNVRASTRSQFARARKSLDERSVTWPAAVVEDLDDQLAAYHSRSARHRPERVARLLTELVVRRRSALSEGAAVPARMVVGLDEQAESKLDTIGLLSLGVRLSADGPNRSADVLLADPKTATVLVFRKQWTGTTARPAGDGVELGRKKLLSEYSLSAMADGHMTIAKELGLRKANHLLELGSRQAGKVSVHERGADWSRLPEQIRYRDFISLQQRLLERAPSMLRSRLLADNVFVVDIAEVERVIYAPGEQTLFARVLDESGATMEVILEYRSCAPGALEALSQALEGKRGPLEAVSGRVEHHREGLVMDPLAVLAGGSIIVPDLEPFEANEDLERRAFELASDPIRDTINHAADLLAEGAHRGLRRVGASFEARVGACAQELSKVGFGPTAALMTALGQRLSAARAGTDLALEQALCDAWEEASVRLWMCRELL